MVLKIAHKHIIHVVTHNAATNTEELQVSIILIKEIPVSLLDSQRIKRVNIKIIYRLLLLELHL